MSKPKLLLLHGALGRETCFKKIVPGLSSNFDIFTLNFSGHGGNTIRNPFSIDLFTQDVIEFIEQKNFSKVNIFGYSMGGYVALNLALNRPELVDQIITLGTKFDWTPESSLREAKMLNPEKIEQKIPAFAEKLRKEHEPEDWKKVMHATAEMMISMGNGQKIIMESLRQIDLPVVIGLGEIDNMVTKNESKNAVKYLIKGNFQILTNTPHPIEKADPNVIVEYISKNLVKHSLAND